MNEAETRAELIDPAIKAAGGGVVDGRHARADRSTDYSPGKTIRCPVANHLPNEDTAIWIIQELPEHADGSTAMIYTHGLNRGGRSVQIPADSL